MIKVTFLQLLLWLWMVVVPIWIMAVILLVCDVFTNPNLEWVFGYPSLFIFAWTLFASRWIIFERKRYIAIAPTWQIKLLIVEIITYLAILITPIITLLIK